MNRLSVLWVEDCAAWMGVMRKVSALEEVHRTGNYYRPMSVGVAKGDGSSDSTPWDPASHH